MAHIHYIGVLLGVFVMLGLGILENLLADALFILLAVAAGWLYLYFTSRSKLLDFFDIDKTRRIVVYLSALKILPGGSIGTDGIRRSFKGSTTTILEMQSAFKFRDLFNYLLPSLAEKPGLLNKILISDVIVDIQMSPDDKSQLEHSTSIITIGSPVYNVASDFVENDLGSIARSRSGTVADASHLKVSTDTDELAGDSGIGIQSATSTVRQDWSLDPEYKFPKYIPNQESESSNTTDSKSAIVITDVPPFTDARYGFVEKVIDKKNSRSIFYCAGLSELGTVGAAHFLANEWKSLYKKYKGKSPFLVLLRFDKTDFRRFTIVLERES